MEEIAIDDYIRRVNAKMVNQLEYSIQDTESGDKILTVTLNNIIVIQEKLVREGSLYSHIIHGKNIKLLYEDFM